MSIALKDVKKNFRDFRLGPINLDIENGGRVAIIGPSGSGKSTLLRIVAGFIKPDRGRVYINGVDVTDTEPWRRGVGVVFQSPALFPSLTVLENVAEPLLSRGVAKREAFKIAKEVLERLELGHLAGRYPAQLSRGQQQRVALARALAADPPILVLDEPLTALDPPLRGEILPYIYEASRGRTVLYVTHDFEEATYIAKRVVVLMDGRIVADGDAVELFENPPAPKVAEFLGYVNKIRADCGYLYFRPWDITPGGKYSGRILASWYRAGLYEVLAEVGGQPVRLILPQPPASGVVTFDIVRGRCFSV
ncbi:carbohydrate ABC transporter ATP-binding protein, CUT1 family [Pyrobaculum islandicum DSM 4184]|uniref:Molybdate/tungstate import ATP-binding protein WtpC n=1 Tax=Pyrobaculum islandicum (strain DSM 4184 / JCM 9189 / GEO3) TaxID=384616 RepID=A1RVX5_PYRIL|nr:ABC transporter ATP-binding protein [Pyrobaculum islandicum]ABL89107.1 carbohydrate ABC transporter ATP-binding protein, CUT1 family [Pyrobaculum islandicum DSM 4184]